MELSVGDMKVAEVRVCGGCEPCLSTEPSEATSMCVSDNNSIKLRLRVCPFLSLAEKACRL